MEFNRTEALKDCRRTLRSINCEAVTDTNDANLYDMLFQSEEKKKILLSWLIQRLYSPETCMKNSFEDLLSVFISKEDIKSFMKGTMSIHEQYKRWKLTMKTLHHLHQTKKQELNTDVIKCVLDGTLLDFYEESWNEKVLMKSKNYGLVNKTNFNSTDLKKELQRVEETLSEPESNTAEEEPNMDALRDNNEADAMLVKFKRADQMLNTNLNCYLQSEGSSSDKSLNDYAFTRSSLDENLIQDIKKHIIMLHENNNTLHQLLHGMESFEPLKK